MPSHLTETYLRAKDAQAGEFRDVIVLTNREFI